MKKIFVLLVMFSLQVFGQTNINSGASFLKIGFGAKNIALGDVGILSADDVTSIGYNPALLIKSQKTEFHFTHNSWMTDVANQNFAAKFYMFELPFAFSVSNFSIKDIEVYDGPGESLSSFRATYLSVNFATAFNITENIALGGTVKYLYQGIYSDEATGWGFDLGGFYSNIFPNLNISASLQNLGYISEFRNDKITLPTSLSVGTDYNYLMKEYKLDSKVFIVAKQFFNNEPTHFHFGFQIGYDNMVFVRSGYQTSYDSKSFSGGFGLNWNNIIFDYAYSPFDYSLGDSHIISFGYSF